MSCHDTLDVEWVDVDRLFANPANPRRNDDAVPHVAASIRRFGWRQPLVAKRTGEVIAGNTRLKAAMHNGEEQVPVVWFEGSDLDAAAYGIADNRTHEFASWDEAALGTLLEQLRSEDALDGVGYTEDEIDALLAELRHNEEAELDDPGPEPPPAHPTSSVGDLWVLGEHRLLCGDSTNLDDVRRVMDGSEAALVATDPPYCVDYTGERPNGCGRDWTDVYREIDIKDPEAFFRGTFTSILAVLAPHAAIYCWHGHKRQPLLARIWEELGILLSQQIVWLKPLPVFGRAHWHWQHEPCLFGWRKGSMPPHDGNGHEHGTVWAVDWQGKKRVGASEHPTEKPLELFQRPMRRHTSRGAVCFEPFSGSGSQLVAAEALGRRCYAIELEPAFVDVAIRRWQAASGKDAVLDGDGRAFAALAEERNKP